MYQRIQEVENKLARAEDENMAKGDIAILLMELEELYSIKNSILKQKVRIDCLKEGDMNTKFF